MNHEKRDAVRLAEKFGLRVDSLDQGRRTHYKLHVTNKYGQSAFFTISNSCSDQRAVRKNESLLRRFAEGLYDPRTKH